MNESKTDKTEKPKVKFNNGWTHELEVLTADWADKASCYRWMHDKSSQELGRSNQNMMIPVIILSTLSGAANFSLATIFPDPASSGKSIATLAIGGISIITGIISTLANFFRYAQLSEAHSTAAISWAKFSRLIVIELALHPNERNDAYTFLKMFRVELDRLIEQSPAIPEFIIKRFQKEFDTKLDVKRPDITGDIKHTTVYDNHNELLKMLAVEAALALMHKKKLMKDLVMVDIDRHINDAIDHRAYAIVQHRRTSIPSSNIYIPNPSEIKNSYVPRVTSSSSTNKVPRSFVPTTNNEITKKNLVSDLKSVFNKNKEINIVVETNNNIKEAPVPVPEVKIEATVPTVPEVKIEAPVPTVPETKLEVPVPSVPEVKTEATVPTVPETKTEDIIEKDVVINTDLQIIVDSELPNVIDNKS